MSITAIYPGTFDPITNGHLDIIERSSKLFDKIIVAVATSTRKSPSLSLDKRTQLIKLATKNLKNVEVCEFSSLLVNFAQEKQAKIIIRSFRVVSDFEFELQLAGMNRHLDPKIETIFMAPAEEYAFISATLVREILSMNGDISAFVPKVVAEALSSK